MAEMHRINLLHQAGHRPEAIEQFHALASAAVRTQREDLTGQGYIVRGHTSDVSVFRIPAQPRPGKPIALFLPGLLTFLPLTAARVLAFVDLFDIVLCELPGHGASGEVADVSLDAFAAEYAALLDPALRHAGSLFVIGESLGGLVALSLAHLRPDRIRNVVLLDTPFHLTRPDLAAGSASRGETVPVGPINVESAWRSWGSIQSIRAWLHTMLHHDMVREAPFNCLLIAGSDRRTSGAASVVTTDDIAMLQTVNPNLLVAQRVPRSGHAVLLDNPVGARAALQTYIVDRTIDP